MINMQSSTNHRQKAIRQPATALLAVSFAILFYSNARGEEAPVAKLKTFGTAGKQLAPLTVDKEYDLFSYQGKGCITHMWFGGRFENDARTRIRVYADGEETASIDMELFLGTGIGFADEAAPWGSEKMGRTGGGDNVYNTYHIPFGKSIRVTGQLAPGTKDHPQFWWIIRGTENLPVQIGGVTLPDNARLKLYRLESHTAQPLEEFSLCDIKGAGALYQVTIAAKGSRHSGSWTDNSFMEGCIRAYFDGSATPTLLSSGFEDYFLGTYYFNKGRYATAIAGVTHLDLKNSEVSAYRFHDADPVFFKNSFKLTARCGDEVNGHVVGDPPLTNYTTYAWVYQW
jgi:hypothetical protein